MNWLINALTKLGLPNEDLDYHLIRACRSGHPPCSCSWGRRPNWSWTRQA